MNRNSIKLINNKISKYFYTFLNFNLFFIFIISSFILYLEFITIDRSNILFLFNATIKLTIFPIISIYKAISLFFAFKLILNRKLLNI